MSEIKAGVTLMTEFCKSHTDVFGKYIDYLDREQAQRNEYISKYNLYQNYMGNPEKTGGLFTEKRDSLNDTQKQQLKNLFSTAQENGSLMWQTVISFDNRWLRDNGLYDYSTGILDETKLKEVTRNAVRKMLKSEELENAVWSAAIHYNTDNIHVHVATVEPIPQRRTKEFTYYRKDGTPYKRTEYVGRFKMKSIEAAKSSVVNQILKEQEPNKQINHIIRDSIIAEKKQMFLSQDPQLSQQFEKIISKLPEKKNLWNYNNNAIAHLRSEIDQLSDMYIAKYHAEDMRQLKVALTIQEGKYRMAYGGSSYVERSYSDTKIKDLYTRLGNAILKEAKIFKEATQSPDDILNSFSDSPGQEPVSFDENDAFMDTLEIPNIIPDSFQETISDEKTENPRINSKTLNKKYIRWIKEMKQIKKVLYTQDGKVDFDKLSKLLKAGEQTQNAFVLKLIGDMYSSGLMFQIDLQKAETYYEKSLKHLLLDEPHIEGPKGNSDFDLQSYIQYRIGKQYEHGQGIPQDYQKAAEYYERSTFSSSKYALGNLFYYGNGVEQDFVRAFSLYSSVKSGNAYAALKCARMYKNGIGCEKSEEQAQANGKLAFSLFECMEKKQPDDHVEYYLGSMLYKGEGCKKNIDEAIEFLSMAAMKKNENATILLCKIYIEQNNTEKLPEALATLESLSTTGNKCEAQYMLGKFYTDLESNYCDMEKGILFLEKAVAQGNKFAKYRAGKLYIDSSLSIYNPSKGIDYLEEEAPKNSYAKYLLGRKYLDKSFEGYNPDRGLQYIFELAKNGHDGAQTKLGIEYLKGIHVERDIDMAKKWLAAAAAQDNEVAANILHDIENNPPYSLRQSKLSAIKASAALTKALQSIKKSMKDEFEKLQNERVYEQMLEEAIGAER